MCVSFINYKLNRTINSINYNALWSMDYGKWAYFGVSKYSPLMDLYFASVYHSKQSKNDQLSLIQTFNLIIKLSWSDVEIIL